MTKSGNIVSKESIEYTYRRLSESFKEVMEMPFTAWETGLTDRGKELLEKEEVK